MRINTKKLFQDDAAESMRDLSPARIVNWEEKTTSRKNALPVKNLARIRRHENSIKVDGTIWMKFRRNGTMNTLRIRHQATSYQRFIRFPIF